jgi:hypothetical protein
MYDVYNMGRKPRTLGDSLALCNSVINNITWDMHTGSSIPGIKENHRKINVLWKVKGTL